MKQIMAFLETDNGEEVGHSWQGIDSCREDEEIQGEAKEQGQDQRVKEE